MFGRKKTDETISESIRRHDAAPGETIGEAMRRGWRADRSIADPTEVQTDDSPCGETIGQAIRRGWKP
ncbi:hypothetical protein [Streptomyces sp. ME19-01-6]|uniref:hypothetical protein n=1 Tax=Streptomyces sp. ME19-01-6 TaxID=3028686 RepID=UPI0029B09EA9|nr:hypothetical protein [Streptomyces sp. ME19-01-6]MDX3232508.1 hypothetical protein [Streptomyces sp. ME19-01-6]